MTQESPETVITKSIVIRQDVARTFQLWTEQIAQWWPATHSYSGELDTQVYIEGKVGGRFFERTSDNREYDWGEVLSWNPPNHFSYTWYLGTGKELPTQVEVSFIELPDNQTEVHIQHSGPTLIGEIRWQRSVHYRASWEVVLNKFEASAHA